MSEAHHTNRAARRRAERAAAKGRRVVHVADPAGVLSQLSVEAAGSGVEELVALTDAELSEVPADVFDGCRRS